MGIEKPARIRELDGWRGISILIVILGHTLTYSFPGAAAWSKTVQHIAAFSGTLGVQTFFVISGFVITRLLIFEEVTNGAVSLKSFYLRRFFRIVPVFSLLLAVVALLTLLGITPVHARDFLLAAVFLKDIATQGYDWFLGHIWTLSVEEQFYVTFPILFVALSGSKRRAAFVCSMVAFLAWSLLAQWGIFGHVLITSAIFGFCYINLGALLALYESSVRSFAARLPSFVTPLLTILLLLHPFPQSSLGYSIAILVIPPCVGLMLMSSISRPSWTASILRSAPLQWVGLISYSAYLWQQLFTAPKEDYGSHRAATAFHWAIPCILLLAAASYYWVERPGIRLGHKFSRRLAERSTRFAEENRSLVTK